MSHLLFYFIFELLCKNLKTALQLFFFFHSSVVHLTKSYSFSHLYFTFFYSTKVNLNLFSFNANVISLNKPNLRKILGHKVFWIHNRKKKVK